MKTLPLILITLTLILAGCQSASHRPALPPNLPASFVLVAGDSQVEVPSFLRGAWQDGIYNGPVEIYIYEVTGNTFTGTMAFVGGSLPGCPTHTPMTGTYHADGTLEFRNDCNGGTILKLKRSSGRWEGDASWGGRPGWIRRLS